MEFAHLKIQLEEIKNATSNFGNKVIGTGGFGKVYEGIVSHSKGQSTVAIKRLDRRYGQGDPEFWKEIMMLSRYTHKNLISLLGFCDEDGEKILVYEYASNGSLDSHLSSTSLTWTQRIKICLDAANGLSYLHDHKGTHQRVLHRDIKSSNILLDANWNAKISDMGLSKLGPANQLHTDLYTNVVGTPGYCDPQYMTTYNLSQESDVYSFGVVLFEVLCGRLCFKFTNGKLEVLVPSWKQKYKHNLQDIIFQDLSPLMNSTSLETFSNIAFKCLHESRERRPTISQVMEKLKSALKFQERHDKKLLEDKMRHQTSGGRTHEPNFFSRLFNIKEGAKQKDVATTSTSKGAPLPPQVKVDRVTGYTLVHFEGSTGFAAEDLLSSDAEILERNIYGRAYGATLKNGDQVAVNRIKIREIIVNQKELETNLNLLGKIGHPNLLAIKAYLINQEGDTLLVSDYMPKGSLALFLNGEDSKKTAIDWPTSMHIAKGTARGLLSLHTKHEIIHGNLTSSSVMLDENNNPKIANFGLSELMKADHDYSKLNATPGTTLNYDRAPELIHLNKANTKTDVYSLGVIMLELLTTAKLAYDVDSSRLVKDALKEQNEYFDLKKLAMDCTSLSPLDRPDVYLVLQQLEKIRP